MPKKARYWVSVLYLENMVEDWEVKIGDLVTFPYAYCVHDQSVDTKSEHRKDHMHLILVFPNTTTYKHALEMFSNLSAEGRKACNTCKPVYNIRNMYDYLIHDTESCDKQGKEKYDPSLRITGNGFDIGLYEQLDLEKKHQIYLELFDIIQENRFTNFSDFADYVRLKIADPNYWEVFNSYSAIFGRLTKGNFQRQFGYGSSFDHEPSAPSDPSDDQPTDGGGEDGETDVATSEEVLPLCCPNCGSIKLRRDGKTAAGKQRFRCTDCGKRFVLEE